MAAFVSLCLGVFVVFYLLGGGSVPGASYYHLQAVVPDALALVPESDVREDGVLVGHVAGIARRGGDSVLMLDIHRQYGPVYRDARVAVGLKSLVGESYASIDRGSPSSGALPNGAVLPITSNDPQTQLDQILSAFTPQVRSRLQGLLAGLGGGLNGHGADLNGTLGSVSLLVNDSQPTVAALAAQRAEVAALIQHVGGVMQAIGERGQAIQLLARQAKATARVVSLRQHYLARTIDALPALLRQAQLTVTHLGHFSAGATGVLANLRSAFTALAPVVPELRSAASEARTTVADLGRFSGAGKGLLTALRSFSAQAVPAIPELDAALSQADPLLAYLSPYGRDIAAFFANTASANAFIDATGHDARVAMNYTVDSLPLFSGEDQQALNALIKAGGLTKSLGLARNPHPRPGQVGTQTPFTGPYPRVEALRPCSPNLTTKRCQY